MEKSKFNSIVLKYFNEIKEKYLFDVKNEWDGEEVGSTILIEDYLLPYVYEHLDDERAMSNLSDLLEELISFKDDYCEEILYCSFFEKIHYENLENKFVPYYKKNTKMFYNQLKF